MKTCVVGMLARGYGISRMLANQKTYEKVEKGSDAHVA